MNIQHPILKDLIWLISSPGLLQANGEIIPHADWFQKQLLAIKTKVIELDAEPDDALILDFQHKPNVGSYFESLVALWLKLSDNYINVSQHLKVLENKRTVGEFDFLFVDKSSNSSNHWEVAVKYYLQYFNGEFYEFLGPNAKDSLQKKTDKMLNQQLKLSQHDSANFLLKDYPSPIKPTCILKGYLFYPTSQKGLKQAKTPNNVNKNHLTGWWTHSEPLLIPQTGEHSLYCILTKPYWFKLHLDIQEKHNKLMNINELKDFIKSHFDHAFNPLLLAEVMQNNNNQWLEVSRGFVVSPHWPKTI